jgi:hypothetical protein
MRPEELSGKDHFKDLEVGEFVPEMGLKERRHDDVDWIQLVQHRFQS